MPTKPRTLSFRDDWRKLLSNNALFLAHANKSLPLCRGRSATISNRLCDRGTPSRVWPIVPQVRCDPYKWSNASQSAPASAQRGRVGRSSEPISCEDILTLVRPKGWVAGRHSLSWVQWRERDRVRSASSESIQETSAPPGARLTCCRSDS